MKNTFITEQEIHERLKQGRTVRMSSETRTRIQAELSAYADMHSVPTALPSPYRVVLSTFSVSRRSAYAFFMLLLLIGTSAGSAFASEKTLPGDILYNVKIKVTEPVRTALAPSAKAKASWEAELAARRLQEATELAVVHKLDSETGDFLSEQFNAHVASTLAAADSLSEAGDTESSADVRSELEARVTAHAAILTLVANHTGAPDTALAVRDLAEEASVTQAAITRDRVALETETTVTVAASSTPEEVPHTDVAVEAVPVLMTAMAPVEAPSATSTEEGLATTTEMEAPEMRSMPVRKKEKEEVASPKEPTSHVGEEGKKREAARAAEIANILKKNSSLIYSLSLGDK